MTHRSIIPVLVLAAGAAFGSPVRATETENQIMHVLPATGHVVVDGKYDDWDLSGGLFACGEAEHLRDQCSVWVHTMYDQDNLYVLARWKDSTPLNNPEGVGGHGFNGDCLQLRFIYAPDGAERAITWWDGWRDKDGKVILGRSSPGAGNGEPRNAMEALDNAIAKGAQEGFTADADGKGYTQELAIPWKLLSISGRPLTAGDRFKMTIEPNFTAGEFGRITIKDLFDEKVAKPDRVFTFQSAKDWGWAVLEPTGHMTPTPVRMADGRTFNVSMVNGRPVVDWTGLIRKFEWPGFKPVTFTMPMDGYVSLNLLNQDGQVVRHMLNWDQRTQGDYTVQWDGLGDATYRTPGQPLPPGVYTWKAIAHPGAKMTLRGYASYGGKDPWESNPTAFWLGDHGVPTAVVTDGQRMYLACNGAEGGRHLLCTDLQGSVIWALQNTTGAIDPESIALDNGFVYVLHPDTISRVDAKHGSYAQWQGGANHILSIKQYIGKAVRVDSPARIDAQGGRIYLTTATDLVILDGNTGQLVKAWPLAHGGAVKAINEHLVYVISGGTQVLALDPATGQTKSVVENLTGATGLSTDAAGKLYVSLDAPDMQVVVFDAQGKEISRVGKKGGRALLGTWQPDGMLHPAGVAVDKEGKLWVMERDHHPKRVSVWSTADGKFIKDFFGPTHYGASGSAINPRDPNLMVGVGCEWRLDPATGKSVCLGTFDRTYHSFATYREGTNGKLYLYTFTGEYGKGVVTVFERLGDANYVKRASLDNRGGTTKLWVDANGDGQQQSEEMQSRPGAMSTTGSNSWSMNLGPDLTLYAFHDGVLKAIAIDGFSACSAPKYDLDKMKIMPRAMSAGCVTNFSCAMPSADNKRILVNLSVKDHPAGYLWHCFDLASGKLLWTYPNPFFQVHGSHAAPAADPGLFRGAYGPVGAVNVPVLGDLWVINGNLGEWSVLSADGFYVTRLFNGNVFEWKWPEAPVPGADMTNVPPGSGGEDFGGSVTQANDGKVYVQAGKCAIWNLLLSGLDKAVAIPGGQVTLTDADVKTATAFRERDMQGPAAASTLRVARATVPFSGDLARDFKGCTPVVYQKTDASVVRTAMAHDDTTLYVGWDVTDSTPWINGAKDISQLYVGGDTVDLQLGVVPTADAKRTKAGKGDIRLSIGNFEGKPTAVLYRFVSDVKKPRTFSSGVMQGYQVDFVDALAEAKVQVKTQNGKYVVEAAIPLASLGLQLTPGLVLRGDVGVTFADPSGTRTKLRSYWSNQQTGLVDDVVFELQLAPQNWGAITFE